MRLPSIHSLLLILLSGGLAIAPVAAEQPTKTASPPSQDQLLTIVNEQVEEERAVCMELCKSNWSQRLLPGPSTDMCVSPESILRNPNQSFYSPASCQARIEAQSCWESEREGERRRQASILRIEEFRDENTGPQTLARTVIANHKCRRDPTVPLDTPYDALNYLQSLQLDQCMVGRWLSNLVACRETHTGVCPIEQMSLERITDPQEEDLTLKQLQAYVKATHGGNLRIPGRRVTAQALFRALYSGLFKGGGTNPGSEPDYSGRLDVSIGRSEVQGQELPSPIVYTTTTRYRRIDRRLRAPEVAQLEAIIEYSTRRYANEFDLNRNPSDSGTIVNKLWYNHIWDADSDPEFRRIGIGVGTKRDVRYNSNKQFGAMTLFTSHHNARRGFSVQGAIEGARSNEVAESTDAHTAAELLGSIEPCPCNDLFQMRLTLELFGSAVSTRTREREENTVEEKAAIQTFAPALAAFRLDDLRSEYQALHRDVWGGTSTLKLSSERVGTVFRPSGRLYRDERRGAAMSPGYTQSQNRYGWRLEKSFCLDLDMRLLDVLAGFGCGNYTFIGYVEHIRVETIHEDTVGLTLGDLDKFRTGQDQTALPSMLAESFVYRNVRNRRALSTRLSFGAEYSYEIDDNHAVNLSIEQVTSTVRRNPGRRADLQTVFGTVRDAEQFENEYFNRLPKNELLPIEKVQYTETSFSFGISIKSL